MRWARPPRHGAFHCPRQGALGTIGQCPSARAGAFLCHARPCDVSLLLPWHGARKAPERWWWGGARQWLLGVNRSLQEGTGRVFAGQILILCSKANPCSQSCRQGNYPPRLVYTDYQSYQLPPSRRSRLSWQPALHSPDRIRIPPSLDVQIRSERRTPMVAGAPAVQSSTV